MRPQGPVRLVKGPAKERYWTVDNLNRSVSPREARAMKSAGGKGIVGGPYG